jgi:hypothetical protein
MCRKGLFSLMLLAAHVCAGEAQVKDGILQFGWGTQMSEVQRQLDLAPVGGIDRQGTFSARLSDLGGIELEDCLLEFFGGRLSGVIITIRGHDNSRKFLSLLKKEYGHGTQESPLGYQWFSPRTHVAYDEDSGGDAYIYWYALHHLREEDARPARRQQ